MSTELRTRQKEPVSSGSAATDAVPEFAPAAAKALAKAVEQVRRDSRAGAQRYLDETVVEYGGE